MSDHALKTLAILNSKAPYSDSAGKDSVDIALVFGSFEQPVSLFFQGDGVWQLVQGQDGSAIAVKDYLKTFSAFEFYDIDDIYVCQNSLEQRNLPATFHIEAVQVLNQRDFAERLTSHHTIFRF